MVAVWSHLSLVVADDATWSRFGIELAPSVVKADGNVRNLAWRVCCAKRVLAPYSMSTPREGASTPTEDKTQAGVNEHV